MSALLSDLRYALRSLKRRPLPTLGAAVTLALGIAATSGVFSLANWLALRPLPGVGDQGGVVIADFHAERGGGVSYPNLEDLRQRLRAFSGLAAFKEAVPLVMRVEADLPRYLRGTLVSADYFSVLGVRMARGRWFTRAEEAASSGTLVTVISDGLWKTVFAADANVVGRTFTLNGLPATVVGVAPRGFHGVNLVGDQDIWVPGSALLALGHFPGDAQSILGTRRMNVFGELVGRLATGATFEQARAQLRETSTALAEVYPQENATWRKAPPSVHRADGVASAARGYVQHVLPVLMEVAGLVLLLAWANVANLFLFRGLVRQGEVTVRRALGGSSGHLIRSQIIESFLVSALAGILGLMLSVWLTSLFHGIALPGSNPMAGNQDIGQVRLDWRVIGFTEIVAVLTGLGLGALAGIVSFPHQLYEGLRAPNATASAGRGRIRGTLVVGQLAVSVALLVTTLLLVASVRNLARIPVGFDAERVTAFAMWPAYSGYSRDQSHALLSDAVSQVRSIQGVEQASLTAYTPFSVSIRDGVQQRGAEASDPLVPTVSAWVGPGYFQVMGITLLGGRGFTDDEVFLSARPGSEGVGIISASQAIKLFGTIEVVGRVVQNQRGDAAYRIIGVVQDSRWGGLLAGSEASPFYQPLPAFAEGGSILVRSDLPTRELRRAVERAVAVVAPSVPVFDVERLTDKVTRSVSEPRLLAKAALSFTLLAVVLAGVGLYVVMAFAVAERTREMGIRIAMGAQAGQIVAMVVGKALRLGSVALAAGLAGALGLSRLVASRLYGVSALDPAAYGLAAAVLLVLVLIASAVPARRATKADPIAALRAE